MIEKAIIIALIGLTIFLFITSTAFRLLTYIIIILILLLVLFKILVKKYGETERAIIYRFGKFNRIAGPGWSIVLPFIEREFAKVDVRTKMVNIHIPIAFTRDDLRVELNGIFYYKIKDPEKALLNIENYTTSLNNLVISETRNVIASMTMRELFANISELNNILTNKIRSTAWKWGLSVDMVQIRSITPPVEIAIAMQSKEIASQQLQAQRFKAEARKIAIEALGEAGRKLDDKSIMYLYLEALKELSKGQATKMIFPMEFINVLKDMKNNPNSALAGLNISGMVNAVKDKILESKE